MTTQRLILLFTMLTMVSCSGNPRPGSGTRVAEGVGILDYWTVRAEDDGTVRTRDIAPEPRPREAITGDDYFQIKLEHIFIGDALGQDVGNVAIITQIEGVVPNQTRCMEVDISDLEFELDARERSNIATTSCAFKHVIAINPVFSDSHVTFDSAFITPPFRMGASPIGLRFIIAQLNDYDLAREILSWGEEAVNSLDELGLAELTQWQSEVINIGFTVANYILDYASIPEYVFEFQTDFVPVETVGGVTTPQNLFMGGDFVIVGFPRLSDDDEADLGDLLDAYTDGSYEDLINQGSPASMGAMVASHRLIFDSGRLYWRDSGLEYRDGPYIVFKVVRQSRYPDELPISLARINREIERGYDGEEIAEQARNVVLDLQDMSAVNETEGRYLLDVFDWFSDARLLEADLNEAAYEGVRPEPFEWPMQMRSVSMTIGPDLTLVDILSRVDSSLERLQNRIYENYERNPGLWQAECVALRAVTQDLVDGYAEIYPAAELAFQRLQVERNELGRNDDRSDEEDDELEMLEAAEIWASGIMNDLSEEVDEPQCPGLRR